MQAKNMGYRPGLLSVSGYWVVSYSIPFQNIGIDPNELAMWDDGLVDLWEDNQRLVLLMRVERYGGSVAETQYHLTTSSDCE